MKPKEIIIERIWTKLKKTKIRYIRRRVKKKININ
jgi:hypothetical protein